MAPPVTPKFCASCGGALVRPAAVGSDEGPPWVCSRCGLSCWEDPKVAVAAVLRQGEGVLLLRRAQRDRAYGRWILPGGFVDRGEVVAVAARREVREELGVELGPATLVGVFSYPGEPVLTIVYEGNVGDGPLRPSREALEVRCFRAAEIPWGELGFRSTEEALRQVFAGLSTRR